MQQAGPHAALLLCMLLAGLPVRALAATPSPSLVLAPSVVAQSPEPGAPADEPSAPMLYDPSAHHLEATDAGLLVRWQSRTPTRGWVLYGESPYEVTQVALDEQLGEAAGLSHSVLLPQEPGHPIYYMPVVDGVPVRKLGAPFLVESAPLPFVGAASSEPTPFHDAVLRLHVVVPAGWTALAAQTDLETEPLLQLVAPDGGWMGISRVALLGEADAPAALQQAVAREWGAEIAVTAVQLAAGAAQVHVQNAACRRAALLDTLVQTADGIVRVSYLAPHGSAAQSAGYVAPYADLLHSLRADSTPDNAAAAAGAPPAALFTLPAAEACAEPDAANAADVQTAGAPAFAPSGAYRCAGAPMFVPVVARSVGPWNCQDAGGACSPYNPSSPDPYFAKPHRGIDLHADEAETPVYAPYNGTVYHWGVSSMRLTFDAPYNGMSSYYAHMASNDGTRDYRVARAGDLARAGETLLGYVGSYNTSAAWPHLHIAFSANGYGYEGNWPTMDPTPFLSATGLVYYPGFAGVRSPVRCAAERTDAFEPDNFPAVAGALAVNGEPQRHDFHAPNDDDWAGVMLAAGTLYRFETLALEPRADTQIAIYDALGKRLLAANDDADSVASLLEWTPSETGRYLVRVRHSSWRGFTFEAAGRARYTPPVFGADTGYSLRVTTNLLLGRAVSDQPGAGFVGATAPSLSNDGLLSTEWVGGCPLELPDQPITPGPTPLAVAGGPRTHWLAYNAGGATMSDLVITWGDDRPTSFVVGWSEDGEVVSGLRYLPTDGAIQHIVWPARPVQWLVLMLEGEPEPPEELPVDDPAEPPVEPPFEPPAEPRVEPLPPADEELVQPALAIDPAACTLRIREVEAWNLTATGGDEGNDGTPALPAPSAPVGDPELLTRAPHYLTSSYFLPLALGPGAGTPVGDQ